MSLHCLPFLTAGCLIILACASPSDADPSKLDHQLGVAGFGGAVLDVLVGHLYRHDAGHLPLRQGISGRLSRAERALSHPRVVPVYGLLFYHLDPSPPCLRSRG